MLAGGFPGAVAGRQFQHLIGCTEPVPCRNLTEFDLLQEFIQKRADAGRKNFRVCHVALSFLRHAGGQFQFASHYIALASAVLHQRPK
jgi:putative intracellular protease/amidase